MKRSNKPKTKKQMPKSKCSMVKKHLKEDMKTFTKEKADDKKLLGKLSSRFAKGK